MDKVTLLKAMANLQVKIDTLDKAIYEVRDPEFNYLNLSVGIESASDDQQLRHFMIDLSKKESTEFLARLRESAKEEYDNYFYDLVQITKDTKEK